MRPCPRRPLLALAASLAAVLAAAAPARADAADHARSPGRAADSRADDAPEGRTPPGVLREGFVRLGFAFTPIVGDSQVAKRFPEAPKYRDAFDPGLGGRLELGYRIGHVAALIGGGFDVFAGDTALSVTFQERKLATVYFGLRAHLFDDAAHAIDPYLGIDIGGGHAFPMDAELASTTVPGEIVRRQYWSGTTVATGRFCLGVEVRFGDSPVSLIAEAGIRFVTGSRASNDLQHDSDLDGETQIDVPLVVGLSVRI